MEKPHKLFFLSQGTPTYENFYKPKKVDREEPFSCQRWGGPV